MTAVTTRAAVLADVAGLLAACDPGHPLRVGIDGVCGAGKTTFARDLAGVLAAGNRPVVHLDSDGFHHVREARYRQGRASARGYYEDAYDLDALRELTLIPLGPGGSHRFARKVHDLGSDAITREWQVAAADAIVLFDCTFLQRDALREHWDHVIFLDTDLDRAQARGVARDAEALGGTRAAVEAYDTRYLAACRIYLAEQDPHSRASIVVEHSDPSRPRLVRG